MPPWIIGFRGFDRSNSLEFCDVENLDHLHLSATVIKDYAHTLLGRINRNRKLRLCPFLYRDIWRPKAISMPIEANPDQALPWVTFSVNERILHHTATQLTVHLSCKGSPAITTCNDANGECQIWTSPLPNQAVLWAHLYDLDLLRHWAALQSQRVDTASSAWFPRFYKCLDWDSGSSNDSWWSISC